MLLRVRQPLLAQIPQTVKGLDYGTASGDLCPSEVTAGVIPVIIMYDSAGSHLIVYSAPLLCRLGAVLQLNPVYLSCSTRYSLWRRVALLYTQPIYPAMVTSQDCLDSKRECKENLRQ